MATKNLWGPLPESVEVRTPTQILKEQAAALENMTRGGLQGRVRVGTEPDGNFVLDLDIVAPALGNYSYNVFRASHGISIYPVTITPSGKSYRWVECPDEESFEKALGERLASEDVRRAIATLIAQSRAV